MRAIVVARQYPTSRRAHYGVFIKNFVDELTAQGLEVQLIVPRPLHRYHERAIGEFALQPLFLSLSNLKIGRLDLKSIAGWSFRRGVMRAGHTLRIAEGDFVYAHFLNPAGLAAASLSASLSIPYFITLGESCTTRAWSNLPSNTISSVLRGASGIVTVSETLRRTVMRYEIPPSRILFEPNVAPDHFAPGSREKARRELGLEIEGRFLIFVGHFSERKGYLDALEVLHRLGPEWKGLFLGDGPIKRACDRVAFSGRVAPEIVSVFLQAADLMLLPTRAEGWCNAIEEAKAVGLPIVSTNIRAVSEQLKEYRGGSVMTPVGDVHSMAVACGELVRQIRPSVVRPAGAYAARARRILTWIANRVAKK